jgi:glutamate 5-kinase
LLVDDNNRLNRDWLNGLAEDIAILRAAGHQVLIVSSGAVAIGSHVLGINPRRSRLEQPRGKCSSYTRTNRLLGVTASTPRKFC